MDCEGHLTNKAWGSQSCFVVNKFWEHWDGGLDIPQTHKRFAGFSKESKPLDAEVHRTYIYAGCVAAYMRNLVENEPEKYQSHFSEYIKREIDADGMEALSKKVHAAIHPDLLQRNETSSLPRSTRDLYGENYEDASSYCISFLVSNGDLSVCIHKYNLKKLTYEERTTKLIERLQVLNSAVEDDDEDDE